MQKLITIYLNNEGYRIQGKRSPDQSHGFVEEYLEDYISDGWEIKLVTGAGGAAGGNINGTGASAWVVVLLEKP